MGYSRNPETIEKRRALLAPLFSGQSTAWSCPVGEEGALAYKIRECLSIAKLHSHEFPELASVASTHKVEILGPGQVQCVPTRNTTEASVRVATGTVVKQGLDRAKPNNFAGPQSATSIISEWLKVQPSNETMRFPQAALDEDELDSLHTWASKPERNLLIFVDGPSVTLKKHTADMAEFAYHPGA